MKAILAVTCVFSAVVLISALTKDVCEAPHPTPSCDGQAPLRTSYYFNNGTGKCESEIGCSNGTTDFSSEGDCKRACPYGIYASND
uniref:Putative secreted protein n=1 Tax=Ixodes scapularis TaxID=6945 RepID=Q4PMZ5_IXOSC|nr:putative secreted protein [Ixodes scapularis]